MTSLAAAVLLIAPMTAGAEDSARLTVVIEGLRSTTGLLRCWLFDSAARFIKPGGAVRKDAVRIDASTMRVTFDGIPFGDYAVAVGHDENEDGDIAKVIGAESRGVSNYDKPLRWYPTFDKAKFPVHGADVEVVVRVF